ncbi:MAG: hypothetical protein ACRC5T_00715 [Cetobacterium sp.]
MEFRTMKTILDGGLHTSIRLSKTIKDLLNAEQQVSGRSRTSLIEEAVEKMLGSENEYR